MRMKTVNVAKPKKTVKVRNAFKGRSETFREMVLLAGVTVAFIGLFVLVELIKPGVESVTVAGPSTLSAISTGTSWSILFSVLMALLVVAVPVIDLSHDDANENSTLLALLLFFILLATAIVQPLMIYTNAHGSALSEQVCELTAPGSEVVILENGDTTCVTKTVDPETDELVIRESTYRIEESNVVSGLEDNQKLWDYYRVTTETVE